MNIAKFSVNPAIAATPSRSRSRAGSDVLSAPGARFRAGPRHATNRRDCYETDERPPSDERKRLHAGVIGEARERAERAEQRSREDDDAEAGEGRGRVASGHRTGATRETRDEAPVNAAWRPWKWTRQPPVRARVAADSAAASPTAARLAAARDEPDPRERHADLAEHLDRDEEADEQEEHAEELPELEQLGGSEAVQRVGDGRDERADRDQDRGRHAAVEPARSSARAAPGSDAMKFTAIANGAMSRLNRNSSPGWLGSSEYGSTRRLGMNT